MAACGTEGDHCLPLQYQHHRHFLHHQQVCRPREGRSFIADILDTFKLADIDEEGFREALTSGMNDFEDAVQYVICMHNGCEVLATRNKADYGDRPGVLAPAELLERIKTAGT